MSALTPDQLRELKAQVQLYRRLAGVPQTQEALEAPSHWTVRRANQPLCTAFYQPASASSSGASTVADPRPLLAEEAERQLQRASSQLSHRSRALLPMQRRMREKVVKSMERVCRLNDQDYAKSVRLWSRMYSPFDLFAHGGSSANLMRASDAARCWRELEREWRSASENRRSRLHAVSKQHEKMQKDHSRKSDSLERKREEAIRRNDMQTYYQLLTSGTKKQQQQQSDRKYRELESFLQKSEAYMRMLSNKIASVKAQQGASREPVQKKRKRGQFEDPSSSRKHAKRESIKAEDGKADSETDRKNVENEGEEEEEEEGEEEETVYNAAHTVAEAVMKQPAMLERGQLRSYQLQGLQWLVSLYNNGLNGILADEMGLGKTLQTLALLAYLWENKGNHGPHLIIVPNSVLLSWKHEVQTWLPSMRVIFYHGNKDERREIYRTQLETNAFNVLVTTYEYVIYDNARLSKVWWKYIIIDEAQRLKNADAKLNSGVLKLNCQYRLLLTGTPLQNELRELWSLLHLLLPRVFDSAKSFEEWFGTQQQQQSGNEDWVEKERKKIVIYRLHQILEPFMLRRLVSDVEGKLPPKQSHSVKCPLSGLQNVVYDWISRTGTRRNPPLSKTKLSPVTNRVQALKKVCNHPRLSSPPELGGPPHLGNEIVRSCGKLWVLDIMLPKLFKAGHKVLLFSSMTQLLDVLELYLQWRFVDGKPLQYRRLDGSTSFSDRERAVEAFNAQESQDFIFLLSIRAAGRGLNLQSADTVVVYDPDPNPKNEEQAIARAHRIGQQREVRVYHLESVVEDRRDDESEETSELEPFGRNKLSVYSMGHTKREYRKSVETLLRENIQQMKVEMADEVIDAGRFDQRTSNKAREQQLEALLNERAKYKDTSEQRVPSLQEMNKLLARSEAELRMFQQMDESECALDTSIANNGSGKGDYWLPQPMLAGDDVPGWMMEDSFSEEEIAAAKGGRSMAVAEDEQLSRSARTTRPQMGQLQEAGNEFEDEEQDDAEAQDEARVDDVADEDPSHVLAASQDGQGDWQEQEAVLLAPVQDDEALSMGAETSLLY